MTNNQLTDERLVKILSETQATIMEHNSRCVRGSVEVDARLFESMLMELQERRMADSEPAPVVVNESQSRAAFEQWCTVNIERNKWHPEFYAHHPATGQWAAWEACRAAMLQAEPVTTANKLGNSPVIPDGYVMVPKEPTKEMIDAGWLHFIGTKNPSSKGTYKSMLAAAPQDTPALDSVQSVVTVSDTWIPASERNPDDIGRYWCYVEDQKSHGKYSYQWNCSWNGSYWSGAMMHGRVTHWMPLPAAPQEVQGE